jgi:hypothetical protein
VPFWEVKYTMPATPAESSEIESWWARSTEP